MPTSEPGVFRFQCDQPEMDMRREKVGAFREQPDQLVPRDLGFARLHHRLDLGDVVAAFAGAARMDEFPLGARRRIAAFHPQAFSPLAFGVARAAVGIAAGAGWLAWIDVGHGRCREPP